MASSESLAAALSGAAPRSIGRSATRGVVWTTVGSLINRLSGLLVFLILARLLLPDEFGVLAAAMVFIALARTIAEAGLTRTLVQRNELTAAHLDSALLVTGGLGAVLSVALFAFAPLVASAYQMPELEQVLMALAVIPFFAGLLSVPEGILRRRLQFRSVAARNMFAAVISDIIGVTLALLGAGVWALVAQSVSSVIIAAIVLWSSVRWMPGRAWEKGAIAELLGFGSHVVGISLLGFFNRRAGELIIGVTLGPVALGLYSVGMRILNLCLDVLVVNVQKVALPVFSRVADDPQRLSRAYLSATEVTTFVAFPGFTLLALFADDLAPLVFGQQWDRVGPLMTILALIGPAMSLALFNNSMMLATNRARLALGWTAVTAVLNVAGFAAGSTFGITAVAAVYVALTWILLFVGLYLVRHVSTVTLREQLRTMGVPFLGSVAMVLFVVVLEELTAFTPLVNVLVGAPAALAVYAAATLPWRHELLRGILGRIGLRRPALVDRRRAPGAPAPQPIESGRADR